MACFCAATQAADRPPNFVVIFTDDQGTLDVNCYGSKDLHTPHMDRLAREGTDFQQFTVMNPVCSPSRAAMARSFGAAGSPIIFFAPALLSGRF